MESHRHQKGGNTPILLERVESRRQLLIEMCFVPEKASRLSFKPSEQCALLDSAVFSLSFLC
jgi:hypothetical protein